MNKNIKSICVTAMGIALYVALSMTAKIPIVGHISLDLGYIVLAVYCYIYGPIAGAIVGAAGCTLVSLLASGWFPLGWLLGNLYIGYFTGRFYIPDLVADDFSHRKTLEHNLILTVVAVFVGIFCIKSVVEHLMYGIPYAVKLPKNAVAFLIDAIVMCIGVCIAPKIRTILEKHKYV